MAILSLSDTLGLASDLKTDMICEHPNLLCGGREVAGEIWSIACTVGLLLVKTVTPVDWVRPRWPLEVQY